MRTRATSPDSAEKTVRDIRRATRRQYSSEEKIRISQRAEEGDDAHGPEHNSGAEPAAMAFVVQVSAQKTEDDARAFYQVLQQKYSSLLGGRDPIIRRAELGQIGGWYRVHIGSFATSEQATALCNKLKDAGGQTRQQASQGGTNCVMVRSPPNKSVRRR